jgi:hypothetical protein
MNASFVLGAGLAGAAFAGAILLILADLSTLIEIKVLTVSKESISGGSHHSYALLILGIFALPMAYGATRGDSRPAMAALAAIGLVALVIMLAVDLPDIHKTGVIGQRFTDASASPKTGFSSQAARGSSCRAPAAARPVRAASGRPGGTANHRGPTPSRRRRRPS